MHSVGEKGKHGVSIGAKRSGEIPPHDWQRAILWTLSRHLGLRRPHQSRRYHPQLSFILWNAIYSSTRSDNFVDLARHSLAPLCLHTLKRWRLLTLFSLFF